MLYRCPACDAPNGDCYDDHTQNNLEETPSPMVKEENPDRKINIASGEDVVCC